MIELLQDLYGQGEIAMFQQLLGSAALVRLLWRRADRVDQHVGVNEPHVVRAGHHAVRFPTI
jgi:hypothetical protein